MGSLTVTAELVPRGPAAAVVLTDEQVAAVGEGAKRFPVRATINGHTLRLSVARMRGEYLLGFSKASRQAAGVQAGDVVELALELDRDPREVQIPAELATALAGDPEIERRFDALAYTHRKEYARWIAEAKRVPTREQRVAKAMEMLGDGLTLS